MYIIRSMRGRAHALITLAAFALAACGAFGREYEYEEELYLNIDGSASVVINSSIPALVALRGLPLQPSLHTQFDPNEARRLYDSLGCPVTRIGQPWYRHGRRFIQIRMSTPDVRSLDGCQALSWSTYRFSRSDGAVHFEQTVGPSATPAAGALESPPDESSAGAWRGNELVAFRVHLPSKVRRHNVRRLDNNETGDLERGNILTWEQRLSDRRANVPIVMQVTMDPESSLYKTLWLFAGSFLAAVIVMGLLIAWTIRKGRKMGRPAGGPAGARPPRG
jgi:hypothetical protein